mmetsp:Transcript_22174/g.30489  ORF Transcript_22174/g.30489 Transcript_22174/m.30489 type:complete len:157 (+) Transcript_22174:294-764(+)
MDRFSAHRTETVENAISNKGYKIFYIPPGCTSILQFQDVYVNKPFKDRIRNFYTKHCIEKNNNVTRELVVQWVVDAQASLKLQMIESGIKKLVLRNFVGVGEETNVNQGTDADLPTEVQVALLEDEPQDLSLVAVAISFAEAVQPEEHGYENIESD